MVREVGANSRSRGGWEAIGWLAFLGSLAGCQHNAYIAPPPPEVVVGTGEQRTVTIYHDYTGTTEASDSIELRARVAGYLDRIEFQDGSLVTRGQLLFVIDRRPYVALLDQAKALLESRRATAVQQESVYRRARTLLPAGAVAQEQLEIDRANWRVAEAAVAQAEAQVRQTQLDLEYTEIRAPIDGRIGRHLADVGNLVVANTTLLATITRYDPMYAYFNVSEANYLAYLRRRKPQQPQAVEGAAPKSAPKPSAGTLSGIRRPVEMGLGDESGYPHKGYIDFSSPTVDPSTGTLLVRGVFANPQPYRLAPGLFARLRVPVGTQPNALLVPESALARDQTGRYLLVVGPEQVVERRSIVVGEPVGDMRVIEQGLKPGERIVMEGLQRARPGIQVQTLVRGGRKQQGEPKERSAGTPNPGTDGGSATRAQPPEVERSNRGANR